MKVRCVSYSLSKKDCYGRLRRVVLWNYNLLSEILISVSLQIDIKLCKIQCDWR